MSEIVPHAPQLCLDATPSGTWERDETIRVRAGQSFRHTDDVVSAAHGWYDVTVTADSDSTWSQRLIGHVETGEHSITGSFWQARGQPVGALCGPAGFFSFNLITIHNGP